MRLRVWSEREGHILGPLRIRPFVQREANAVPLLHDPFEDGLQEAMCAHRFLDVPPAAVLGPDLYRFEPPHV